MSHQQISIRDQLFRPDRLVAARKQCDLTPLQLAKRLDYRTDRIIANWESGFSEPSIHNLARLCRTLNVSADWLLGLGEGD